MANRTFYYKYLGGDLELCLACGWVEPGHCVLFTRNINTREEVDNFGIMKSKDAHEAFNATKGIIKDEQ
jgi:hypothetical protein